MSRRFFSAESAHGSATSRGFSNDTIVLAFNSKRARDAYVAASSNLSCEAILFHRVTKMAANYNLTRNTDGRPNTFRGEFWGIESLNYVQDWAGIGGLIGQVSVCFDGHPMIVERLYK